MNTAEETQIVEENTEAKKESQFLATMTRLFKNKVSLVGFIMLCVLVLIAIFAPILAPYSPKEMDFANCYATPSRAHPFGCDNLGRDLLSRVIYGARYSLSLGFIASLLSALLGVLIGAPVGYAGGRVDNIVMRFFDVIQSIPTFLLCVLISAAFGTGYVKTIIAMIIGNIPAGVRSVRSMCLKEREMEYLEAAKSINCSKVEIIFKHMTPNILAPTIVSTAMSIGGVIMQASSLAYIGLGVQPPTPEWGAMLSDGRAYILTYPHMLLFPGIAICVTVIALNLFGDGLRDALDPKLKD